jgi:membrane protein implicated in regulation of membrane protease activity
MANQKSARTLLWLSLILLLVGAAIGDPTAGFAVMVLAGLSALGPVALGGKRLKIIGLVVLVASIGLAMATWPEAKSHQGTYMERVKNAAAGK